MKPLSLLLLALLLLAGCGGPKRVSGDDFAWEYRNRNQQTVRAAEYLGEKDGYSWLRVRTKPLVGSEWKERLWYSKTDELIPPLLEQIRKDHGNKQYVPER